MLQVDRAPSAAAVSLLQQSLSVGGVELPPAAVSPVSAAAARQMLGDSLYDTSSSTSSSSSSSSTSSSSSSSSSSPSPSITAFYLLIRVREARSCQIAEMCRYSGMTALRVHRVGLGRVFLGALPQGKWRYILSAESFI